MRCKSRYDLTAGRVMFFMSLGFYHVIGKTLFFSTQLGLLWLLGAILFWLCWGLKKGKLTKFAGGYTIFVAFFMALDPAIAFFNTGKVGW
jgi:hypothetical protein